MADQRKPRRAPIPSSRLNMFGQAVEERREAAGLSKSALAEAMETSRAHLNRILTSSGRPTVHTVRRMAEILGMDIAEALALTGHDIEGIRQSEDRLALVLTEAERHTVRRLRVWFDEARMTPDAPSKAEVSSLAARAARAHPLMPRLVQALMACGREGADSTGAQGAQARTRAARRAHLLAARIASHLGNDSPRVVELVISTGQQYISARTPVLGVMPWEEEAGEGAGFRRAS